MYQLSKDQISEYKELFILFDKDMNGVLSFTELAIAMKTLGQRLSGKSQFILVRAKCMHCLCGVADGLSDEHSGH